MSLINEKNVSNADLVAAINNAQPQSPNFEIQSSLKNVRITNDPNAKEIRISEDDLFKTIFTEKHSDVITEAKKRFIGFRQDREFNKLMRKFKQDPNLYRPKYLDSGNPKSAMKPWFSRSLYDELAKHYQLKTV